MSGTSERAIERAEEMVALERDVAVRAVSARLAAPGRRDCLDCGDTIEAARRAALPSAMRCADCEGARERKARRGW